ncbi:MAG TPA: hypothetical protein VFP68_05420 [Burkholderiaceae bacterium]|nr:hypothetical protein [Burkholderiaceae bacterium]
MKNDHDQEQEEHKVAAATRPDFSASASGGDTRPAGEGMQGLNANASLSFLVFLVLFVLFFVVTLLA